MSKKAAGQARKADAAAAKAAAKDNDAAAQEAKKWDQGSKSNAKAEAAAAKAAEAARKKAEKEALLKEEEAALPSKPKGAGAKKAEKKTAKGIDSALSSFGGPSALNATGIDNALDALDITHGNKDKVDRHPERRFKAAYAQYEERRLEEMKDEKGLRRQQRIDMIRKEFEKHPDNPFNQVAAAYNTSKDELADIAEAERVKKEKRLGNPTA
ncbi:DUF1014-domain-containing protein [Amniculicola lignicola CBS 123094]|uniref:DUF1014-domain-containing protein n=1 Tax=Amniculicola lignicola CBS 123094 TaxID=1392246 RepID=A0A6A5WJ04_9PLEO|nr:DUF1014-domain-containing protein [Amniculicola lignicola CBS 123094]